MQKKQKRKRVRVREAVERGDGGRERISVCAQIDSDEDLKHQHYRFLQNWRPCKRNKTKETEGKDLSVRANRLGLRPQISVDCEHKAREANVIRD